MKGPHSALTCKDTYCLWGVHFIKRSAPKHLRLLSRCGRSYCLAMFFFFFWKFWNYWRISIDENSWAHLKLKIDLFIKNTKLTWQYLDPTENSSLFWVFFYKQTLSKHYFIYLFLFMAILIQPLLLNSGPVSLLCWILYLWYLMNPFTVTQLSSTELKPNEGARFRWEWKICYKLYPWP